MVDFPLPSKPGITAVLVDPVDAQRGVSVVDMGNGTNGLVVSGTGGGGGGGVVEYNVGSTATPVSATTPLPVAGTGATGATAPASAVENGFINNAGNLVAVTPANGLPTNTPYQTPDGRLVSVQSNMGLLLSDDFGGSAIDTTKWQVIDGGYAGIGTGTTGITDSVANSALTVNMGTVSGAERWYLSQQIFSGAEDVTFIMARSSTYYAQNYMFFGLVEVDANGNPKLNPNLAGYFTNMGGVELGGSTSNTYTNMVAIGDSSPNLQSVTSNASIISQTFNTLEYLLEFRAEDIILSTTVADTITGKNSNVARIASQVPDDTKQYKLLMRFRNIGAPAANATMTIQRALVVGIQESRVEISSGRGDTNAQKGIASNVVNTVSTISPGQSYGQALCASTYNTATVTNFKYASVAGTPAASLLSAGTRNLYGGTAYNSGSTAAYLKIYNSATAGAVTVGTTATTLSIPLPPNTSVSLDDIFTVFGVRLLNGLVVTVTGGFADTDTTAVTANQVMVNLTVA